MAHLIPACQGLLAVVFLVSAASKLRSGQALRAFATSLVSMLAVRGDRALPIAITLTAAEAVVVVLLAVPPTRDAGFAAATALLVVLTSGVAVVLARGGAEPCRCFGASSTPLSGRHLIRNLLLTAVALAGLIGPDDRHPSPWSVAVLLAGGLAGLLVTLLDDLVALFAPAPTSLRRPDGVRSRGRGPARTAGRDQSDTDRRRHTPAS
ncbi:MauE/DoxX family redox-associated membrane protein [Streptosporangium sp. NBC_01469]|uniref:MauE/DoxX family redox-associated membrane protein n=1 Tax=Streptosporangium sp. NBC_01469 TaxID=2903898 RepID=UPI002E29FA2B|nr:MauE/DoxX family redox-associated membrane protein [Streptosporangium sp. NBC_01469]